MATPPTFQLRTLSGVRDLLPLAAVDPQRYPGLLQSAAQGAHGRYDILFATSGEALVLHHDGRVRDMRGVDLGGSFLDALDHVWTANSQRDPNERAAAARDAADSAIPFRGGWLLFLGYELAQEIEPVLKLPAPADTRLPVALALRCPGAIIVDHQRGCTHLLAEHGAGEFVPMLERDLETARALPDDRCGPFAVDEDAAEMFLRGIDRVRGHLAAGDVFQVNLSREWRARSPHDVSPAAVYAALRCANPAPFAGLLQWNDAAIVSSSPERLIDVRGNSISARPIAGTRARFAGDDDAARRRELIGNPKERAEHVMLIDLERNDLGRVCQSGSIAVDELMTLESYAHVHHIVSNVRGTLRAGATPGAIIRAVFPGGTITGCPKVRTMQIIAELERCGRGAYTGSLGYLNADGDLDLNILIRSLTLQGRQLRFRAGAGIVADSIGERELDETRAKARGLLRALGVDT